MAWNPTAKERDLELVLFGAMLGNQNVAKPALERLGDHAFYNSDVSILVDCLRGHIKGKPLKENEVFAGWCKRMGIELGDGAVVDAIATAVNEKGKRRAANRALTMLKFGNNLSVESVVEEMKKALEEIGR